MENKTYWSFRELYGFFRGIYCTDFCNHCPEKYKVNAGVAKIEIFCQDIYDALIRWKVVNADDISLDKILDNFTCKYNAERLTSK